MSCTEESELATHTTEEVTQEPNPYYYSTVQANSVYVSVYIVRTKTVEYICVYISILRVAM